MWSNFPNEVHYTGQQPLYTNLSSFDKAKLFEDRAGGN